MVWLQDVFPEADQFNSLHEKLVTKWKNLAEYLASPVYFEHDGSFEDSMTAACLRDTAEQAGLVILDRDAGHRLAGEAIAICRPGTPTNPERLQTVSVGVAA